MLPVYLAGPFFGDTTPSEAPSTPVCQSSHPQVEGELGDALDEKEVEQKDSIYRRVEAVNEQSPTKMDLTAEQNLLIHFGDDIPINRNDCLPPAQPGGIYEDLLDIELHNLGTGYSFAIEHLHDAEGGNGSPADAHSHQFDASSPHDGSSPVHVAPLGQEYDNTGEDDEEEISLHPHDAWTNEQWKDLESYPPSSSPTQFFSSPMASSQTSGGGYDVDCDEIHGRILEDHQVPSLSPQGDALCQVMETGERTQSDEISAMEPDTDDLHITIDQVVHRGNEQEQSINANHDQHGVGLDDISKVDAAFSPSPACASSEPLPATVGDGHDPDDNQFSEPDTHIQAFHLDNGELTTTLVVNDDVDHRLDRQTWVEQNEGDSPQGFSDMELMDPQACQMEVLKLSRTGFEINAIVSMIHTPGYSGGDPDVEGAPHDSGASSPSRSDVIQGSTQQQGQITLLRVNTDEKAESLNEGGDRERPSELGGPGVSQPNKSNSRLQIPLVPNPRRPTVAGQVLQRKKLSKPFRCPTISSVAIQGAAVPTPYCSTRLASRYGQQDKKTELDPLLEMPKDDSKIKHRTERAATQFKSPLTVIPPEKETLIRPTPTIQVLERTAQTLKRALRVVREKEEETLQTLAGKWTEAGREVAFELWTLVKDSAAAEGSGDSWSKDRAPDGKRKTEESWGWDDGRERKRTLSGNGSSWGWESSPGRDIKHDEGASEDDEDLGEARHNSIGTMLMQLGICPTTLGWDEEEGCFVD